MPEVPSDQAKETQMPRSAEFSTRPPRIEIKAMLAGAISRFNNQQEGLRAQRREQVVSRSRAEALLSGQTSLTAKELSEITSAVSTVDSTTPSVRIDQQHAQAETARLVQELQTVLAQRQILAEKAVQDWLVQVYVESVRGVMHSSNGTPVVVRAVEEFEASGKVFNFPLPEPLREFFEQLPKKLAAVFIALLITACTVQPASAEHSSTATTIESVETDAATVGDDLEQRPTATPTPHPEATPRPTATKTPERVAMVDTEDSEQVTLPTATPSPEPTPPPAETSREVNVAILNLDVNIRSDAGTTYTALGQATGSEGDRTFELTGVKKEATTGTALGVWHQIKLPGNSLGWVHFSVFTPGVIKIGPNTGGLEPAAANPVESAESENTVTIEALAKLIPPIELGGNDPLTYNTEYVTQEEGELRVNKAFVRMLLIQTGLSEAELADVIKDNGEITIKIPAQRQDRMGGRSPSWLGEPQEITIRPAQGIAFSFFQKEADLEKSIKETMEINGQMDLSGNEPTDLRLTDKTTNEIVGSILTVSSTGTYNYLFVDSEGKFHISLGRVESYSRATYVYYYLLAATYAELLTDSVNASGKGTEYLLLDGINRDYREGQPTKIGTEQFVLPEELSRGQFYTINPEFTEFSDPVFNYE